MWNSISVLNAIAFWGLWTAGIAGGIAAIAGLAGGLAATRSSDISSKQAEIKIAEANARAEDAKLKAEKVRLEMERERLARLKLEEKVKPRRISAGQKAIMIETLRNAPRGQVFVNPDWTDAEAKIFGADIAEFLKHEGYSVSRLSGDGAPISYGILGVCLVIRDGDLQPPHLRPIHDAFKAAGIEITLHSESYVPDANSVFIGVSTK
jgi:hypothetical protein